MRTLPLLTIIVISAVWAVMGGWSYLAFVTSLPSSVEEWIGSFLFLLLMLGPLIVALRLWKRYRP